MEKIKLLSLSDMWKYSKLTEFGDDENGQNIILRTYSLSYPEEYWLFICVVWMAHQNNFAQGRNRPEIPNQTWK